MLYINRITPYRNHLSYRSYRSYRGYHLLGPVALEG